VNYNLPVGKLIHTIGEVNDPKHYYEYLLYCKKLHVSQRTFNQVVLQKLKDISWDLPFREAKVFTIDGPTSIDLDDGFSVDADKVSVYISCVPYVLNRFDLWKHMTSRVSTIYFPDKRHPLLPGFLSTLCSLNEGTLRPCLVLDLYLDGTTKWSMCSVKIHKNYTYDNVCGQDYDTLLQRSGCKTSDEVVHHYMTQYNTESAVLKKGIHLNIHKPDTLPEDWLPVYFNQYSFYDTTGNYVQMTSPIRRLVDILNMSQWIRELGLYPIEDHGFHEEWYQKLDTLNTQYRSIRKAQNTTKLLDLFDQNQHKVFEGTFWEQKVYLKDIGLMVPFTGDLEEKSTHSFQIYVFHDEAHLKRKVRIQLV
jgi:exoribonuclease R